LESKTVFNVLIACRSSTSDQAENASFASPIEHVHHFTVTLPHRMQGMIPSLIEVEAPPLKSIRHAEEFRLDISHSSLGASED
jgi:hypothetical protein